MTDEELADRMAKAMAKSVRDPQWSHYRKPAQAALVVAKAELLNQQEA